MKKENLAVSLFLKRAGELNLISPLVFGAPVQDIPTLAEKLPGAHFMTDNVLERSHITAQNISVELINPLTKTPEHIVKTILVFIPKSKALINSTLELAARYGKAGTPFILVGEKAAGIESAKFAYERYVGVIEEKLVGNHSALYRGTISNEIRKATQTEPFIEHTVESNGVTIKTAALAGVFNHGALDDGTTLLLNTIPFDKKIVLDMACGSGVIGTIYKTKNPEAEVDFSDASIYATLSATETLKRNSLIGNVYLSDVFSELPKKEYDLIVLNPPFHIGIDTDYSFIEKFSRGVGAYMKPKAEIYTVANKFLKYKPLLEEHVGPTEIAFEDRRYTVYKTMKQTGRKRRVADSPEESF